ncbi:TPA: helix-turn-helix domain-containing protein, partial [Escherichia coli]|nr:helix-turn-helix domain-containing protein [Escherichia coli]
MVNKAIKAAIDSVGSQQKLADACGVKQPSVWAWLHGKKRVSAENAKRIEMAT